MFHHCYLRKGIVYLPTVARAEPRAGYMDIDPVAVAPVSDTAGLRRALHDTVARGNPSGPSPAPGRHPVLLKYAGVSTFGAFARGTTVWSIKQRDGSYEIVGYRKLPDKGWEENPDRKIPFAPGSGVDEVCERMIAILQENARSPGR